jgi:hypothetical protein
MAAADWFAHAEVAEPAPRRRARPAQKRPAAPVRSAPRNARRRVRAPILWMSLFAALLGGVVAINVAVLRAHVAVTQLDEKRAHLQAQNQMLASDLSAATSAPRIEAAARRLGLVPAPGASVSYLDLTPHSP